MVIAKHADANGNKAQLIDGEKYIVRYYEHARTLWSAVAYDDAQLAHEIFKIVCRWMDEDRGSSWIGWMVSNL